MKISIFAVLFFSSFIYVSFAQEVFDSDQFIKQLNSALKEKMDGVTFKFVTDEQSTTFQDWATAVTQEPQDFGLIITDATGKPVDIFGSSTPFQNMNGTISIPGYTPPPGGSIKMVGAAGWVEGVTALAAEYPAAHPPNSSIEKAISTITAATDYIAQELCSRTSRPTKLVLNINAGFELVFNATTGSEVEWDLEIVCNRKEFTE